MPRANWTREETILALALYCKIPFGRINKTNPQIVQVAESINRTPSALAMKMCNFGRFDPELSNRGVSGLQHGSQLDKEIWEEFHQDMESLYNEVKKVAASTDILLTEDEQEDLIIPEGVDVEAIGSSRRGQAFFRSTVLSAYNNTCCITGIDIPKLLQASHIKSWSASDPATERNNPTNGLCLNHLHHRAFDEGYITIDTDYRIIVSKEIKDRCTMQVYQDYFVKYDGQKITLPQRFLPSIEMIQQHNLLYYV